MTTRWIKKGEGDGLENVRLWSEQNRRILGNIGKTFETVPNLDKWGMDTWEWTVHRELFDHLADSNSYYLDLVVGEIGEQMAPQEKLDALVEITAIYEMILKYDVFNNDKDFGLYKNLGLAYMHMVRSDNTLEFRRREGLFLIEGMDIFDDLGENFPSKLAKDYKDYASLRWGEVWKQFLAMEGSENDGSYATVKTLIERIFGA